jgi:hypothetical protein
MSCGLKKGSEYPLRTRLKGETIKWRAECSEGCGLFLEDINIIGAILFVLRLGWY